MDEIRKILDGMKTLGWTADEIFSRIRVDLSDSNVSEARGHLDFVDQLLAANKEGGDG